MRRNQIIILVALFTISVGLIILSFFPSLIDIGIVSEAPEVATIGSDHGTGDEESLSLAFINDCSSSTQ